MNEQDLLKKIGEVLDDHSEKPSEEMRKLGSALIAMADIFEGRSRAECRALLNATAMLQDIKKPETPTTPPQVSPLTGEAMIKKG
jgi:hypothetical protein